MITTEQVREAAGGSKAAKGWVREYVKRPQLSRIVGGLELKVFVAKRGGKVQWERRFLCARWISTFGECDTWEEAMSAAEKSARSGFSAALEEL